MLATAQSFAQCTPDTTTPNVTGLYPDYLPDDTLGQFYSQEITFVYPKDTIFKVGFLTFPVKVCEIKVLGVTGMPDGMSYQLSSSDSAFRPNFADSNRYQRGCVIFSGTPTTKAPNDSMTVQIRIIPGDTALDTLGNCVLFNPGFDISAFTTRTYKVGFKLIDTTNAVAPGLVRAVALAPNPARGSGRASFLLTEAAEVQASILDLAGHTVWQSDRTLMQPGTRHISLDYKGLAPGVYMVAIAAGDQPMTTTRLLIAE